MMSPNKMIIIGICLLAVLAALIVYRGKWVLKCLSRGVGGGLAILLVNNILGIFSLVIPVGVNLITLGISAILGIPGILLLYAVEIYNMLS